jgi:hypothetical protein
MLNFKIFKIMENISYKLIFSFAAIFGLLACNNDEDNFLSADDQIAVEGMQTSYVNAGDHNIAFKISIEENDSVAIHMHDSLFHQYVDIYDEHHSNYSHDSYHDDHHHDVHGMHMSNNILADHHDWTDGHHSQGHDLMEELLENHDAEDHNTNDHHEDNNHMGNH